MEKKVIVPILICLIGSIGVVTILFFAFMPSDGRSSFTRNYVTDAIVQVKTLDVKFNSYNIAGATHGSVYLSNATAPLHVLAVNASLTDTSHVQIKTEKIPGISFSNFTRLKIDSPNFYLADGVLAQIAAGSMANWTFTDTIPDTPYFSELVPMGNSSFAVRSLNSSNEYVLGKLYAENSSFRLISGLLEKQIDGRFCVDGMLHYNAHSSELIYVYVYRNQFTVIDSSMNVIHRGRTIDTISRAPIEPAFITSGNTYALSNSPHHVNKRSCTFKDKLLIHSGTMAANENRLAFEQGSVIDVYSLEDYTYEFSFYLPNLGKERLREFRVFNNILYALYDHYLVGYDLNRHYFQPEPKLF